MFGLKRRVENLASTVTGLTYVRRVDTDKIGLLEEQIEKLTRALEWHTHMSIDLMLTEKRFANLSEREGFVDGQTGRPEVARANDAS